MPYYQKITILPRYLINSHFKAVYMSINIMYFKEEVNILNKYDKVLYTIYYD